MFRNNLNSKATIVSGTVVAQANVTWTTNGLGEAVGGFYLYKDSSNYIYVGARSTGGTYRILIYVGGVKVYDLSTSITKGKDIKIWTDGTTIKIFYWNTAYMSVWSPLCPAQTISLPGPYHVLLSCQQSAGWTGAIPVTFDNVYFWNFDYITQYPSATAAIYSPVYAAQGTILLGDTGGNLDSACEPCVMYEGNAQILTGNVNVFKMWYSNGHGANPENLCYAESLTGLPGTWQKYPTPLLVNSRCNDIIKYNGVYYLIRAFSTTMAQFDLYTSTDGVHFTLDTAAVLTKGTTGAWDDLFIANKHLIIENEVAYMFYEGCSNASGVWKVGLAISTDGHLRVWNKYGSTPIINCATNRSGPNVIKIGSNFYYWGHGTNGGGDLPSDIHCRYKSSDLLSWAQDTAAFVYTRVTDDEGPDPSVIGQVADAYLLEANNKVYLFHSASKDGLQSGTDLLHIKLAIADMPFTTLILTEEKRIA